MQMSRLAGQHVPLVSLCTVPTIAMGNGRFVGLVSIADPPMEGWADHIADDSTETLHIKYN